MSPCPNLNLNHYIPKSKIWTKGQKAACTFCLRLSAGCFCMCD
ncbi:hypothetical protein HMPREF0476_1768 [Kingella kingae ATCC 23330]|uniref:Uncharacterized protein n=1 Tax=Kingella kingae ATCC 23330 TaxID=887327 RepID=F5S985_KINKI|nr:hypothetical protein HMPREF0476_1768 [Kingella kingae ATCC 23330]